MKFVQIGVTALRDPVTGELLPAVPLYIRAEDAEKPEIPKADEKALRDALAEKMKAYHLGLMREGLAP